MAKEKKVNYTTSNTYTTLNTLTEKTKNVWLVFHGMGYLSRYFTKYFTHLDPEQNYIIAPQAPSKYYFGKDFKHVGASWLTRENTIEETKNVLNYIDALFEIEKPLPHHKFIILGYSQGVSIATRWMVKNKITCDHLVLHSGGIPIELMAEDFSYLEECVRVSYLYGSQDQYINEAKKTEETLKGKNLFGGRLEILEFDGLHEVNTEFLATLA
jgi:predicted esterase